MMKRTTNITERRDFLKQCFRVGVSLSIFGALNPLDKTLSSNLLGASNNPSEHHYGMGINVKACIGCGRCVIACKNENNVPPEPFYFRTWIEKYSLLVNGETTVDSPKGGSAGFGKNISEKEILRSFFVPKLCNHCKNPPCVQVCPVGATFATKEGVVLVDKDYCIGCRYCIQACPYGARFLNPFTKTADKCTFCYHRLVKNLLPACVEVCPTKARIFGDTVLRTSQLTQFFRFNEIQVLKPELNTDPQVFYARLDGEVR
jgi:Fe-S-cluster-containing dehydrogenase component